MYFLATMNIGVGIVFERVDRTCFVFRISTVSVGKCVCVGGRNIEAQYERVVAVLSDEKEGYGIRNGAKHFTSP